MREQETIRTLVDMLSASQAECRALRTTGVQVHQPEEVEYLQKELNDAGDTICERDERIRALEDQNDAFTKMVEDQAAKMGGLERALTEKDRELADHERWLHERDDTIVQVQKALDGLDAEWEPPPKGVVELAQRVVLSNQHMEELFNGSQEQVRRVLDDLNARNAEVAELADRLADESKRVASLTDARNTALVQVEHLEGKVDALRRDVSGFEEQVGRLAEERNDWRDRAESANRRLRAREATIGELEAQLRKASEREVFGAEGPDRAPDVYADSAHAVVTVADRREDG